MNNEKDLIEKTRLSKKKNLITFYGNRKHPLPASLFYGINKIYKKREQKIKNFSGNRWLMPLFKNCYTYCNGDYENMKTYEFYNYNTSISLSKYYDYERKTEVFYVAMGCDEISADAIYLENKFKCMTDNVLTNFYNKWRQFRIDNPNKYNKPHKYTINLHILENSNCISKESSHNLDKQQTLSLNLWNKAIDNCIKVIYISEFNITGEDLLLYKNLKELIRLTYCHCYKVALTTNGVLVTEDFIKNSTNYIDTIRFSIDSFDENTLIKMGKKPNEILTKERFLQLCRWIKKQSFNKKIEVNTIISSLNCKENLASVLKDAGIDKWNISRNGTFDKSKTTITDKMYNEFFDINSCLKNIIMEDNVHNNYIMINPKGFLVDNTNNKYEKVVNILDENFIEDLRKTTFSKNLYFTKFMYKKNALIK